MIWSRLDDTCIDHPKVLGLSDKAFRLWVCSIVYCSRHLTDGCLDERAVALLGAYVSAEGVDERARLTAELVTAGLWDRVKGHLSVHDFLQYNPSREKVLAEREKRSRAGRKGGKKSGRSRRQQKPTEAPAEANAQALDQSHASADSEASAEAFAGGHSEPRPSPSTKERGDAPALEGAAAAPRAAPDRDVPEELAGLSPEEREAHAERVRHRIARSLRAKPPAPEDQA